MIISSSHHFLFLFLTEKYWLDDVICQGDEKSLAKCVFNRWGASDCGKDEAAGVVCTRESETPKSNQSKALSWTERKLRDVVNENTAQIRLVGGRRGMGSEGRVEVRYHVDIFSIKCTVLHRCPVFSLFHLY